ncbi:hypothetical protein F5X97DRAFT_287915 [Nemania serpens]|nr:hypothetical protein F5X97DRAFT_287915 [Nemania serpens]
MNAFFFLFSLMAAASASKALHYTVPSSFKAVAKNCSMPAEFTVTNFTTYTDTKDNSSDTVSFDFNDPDTQIRTTCQRNSTSIPSGPSKNKYACNNTDISFIYQTTGVAGLTLVEKACSGGTSLEYEASGLVTPELNCTATYNTTLCHAKEASLQGDFDSFEPIPPKPPVRRDPNTWRG